MEEAPADVGSEMQLDTRTTCALPVDGNLARVATERRDVRFDEPKRFDLVVEPCIEVAQALALKFGDGQEADRV